jgi:UDP-N-acetylglucosamine acyltransferase
MPSIHPLSAVSPQAKIADDVEIGPFCNIGPGVVLGSGCGLVSHVVILGNTTIGKNNLFFPHCAVGIQPQDKKYRGGTTRLEIGDNNHIRESVTIHLGTEAGGGVTRVGSNNLLMVNAHIAHDAQVGNNCIIGNNAMIAGHVQVGNFVAMMGGVGIHHYVTVGDFAYLAGYARIRKDAPPFLKIDGADIVRGVNTLGLERAPGFPRDAIGCLEEACRKLFYGKEKPIALAIEEVEQNGAHPKVKELTAFLRRRNSSKNGRYLEALRQA